MCSSLFVWWISLPNLWLSRLSPGQVSGACAPAAPVLYDASLDPWNVPEPYPSVSAGSDMANSGVSSLGGAGHPPHQFNPGASAFYPVVPTLCRTFASHVQNASASSSLPRFGTRPESPSSTEVPPLSRDRVAWVPPLQSPGTACSPSVSLSAHPVRGSKCAWCNATCILSKPGHSIHRCPLHKIP